MSAQNQPKVGFRDVKVAQSEGQHEGNLGGESECWKVAGAGGREAESA